MDGATAPFRRANCILETEGFLSLLRHALTFAANNLFHYQRYYLYVQPTEIVTSFNSEEITPKAQPFTFKIVSSNEELKRLEAEGLELRPYAINTIERLDKGAVAFCIFVGRELANISWLAMNKQAQWALDEPPCEVDYSNREVYRGGIWTNPRYRRMRFSQYSLFKKLEYMRENGIFASRVAIAKSNVVSQHGQARFAPALYGEGRYLRILWWRHWQERPLPPPGQPGNKTGINAL